QPKVGKVRRFHDHDVPIIGELDPVTGGGSFARGEKGEQRRVSTAALIASARPVSADRLGEHYVRAHVGEQFARVGSGDCFRHLKNPQPGKQSGVGGGGVHQGPSHCLLLSRPPTPRPRQQITVSRRLYMLEGPLTGTRCDFRGPGFVRRGHRPASTLARVARSAFNRRWSCATTSASGAAAVCSAVSSASVSA